MLYPLFDCQIYCIHIVDSPIMLHGCINFDSICMILLFMLLGCMDLNCTDYK